MVVPKEKFIQWVEEHTKGGAIFNLANIALTAEKYAREIIVVMEKALEQEQRTPDQLEYVKNRIAAIKAAHGYK